MRILGIQDNTKEGCRANVHPKHIKKHLKLENASNARAHKRAVFGVPWDQNKFNAPASAEGASGKFFGLLKNKKSQKPPRFYQKLVSIMSNN